jgi:predicted Zn-dependent peptidase
MCFKGTKKRPTPRDISGELDSVGAANNAFTGKERTVYYAKADAKHFEKIADVISDIFLNSTFPEKEMEKERGVIMGEIDMYEDDPRDKVWDVLMELMYGNQPAGWSTLGPKKNIKSFTRRDFIEFRSQHYKPSNTVVVIAGGISEKRMLDFTRKAFAGYKKAFSPTKKPTKESQTKPQMKILNKKTDQAHIVLGFRAFDMKDGDRYSLRMMRNVLSGGMSSRLFTRIREEMGAGYYISAGFNLHDHHGYFTVSTGTEPGRVVEVVGAILDELKKIKQKPVPNNELKKVKNWMKGKQAMSLETSDDVADFFGDQELFFEEIKSIEDYEKIYSRITSRDIIRVAKRVIRPETMNLAIVGKNIDESSLNELLISFNP